MFNLQGSEIIMILLVALVVLGPEKLPDAVRKFTETYSELKKMSRGFQSELKSALDEPMREMRETAGLVRDAADPKKLIEEAEREERLLRNTENPATENPATENPATENPATENPATGDAGEHDAGTDESSIDRSDEQA